MFILTLITKNTKTKPRLTITVIIIIELNIQGRVGYNIFRKYMFQHYVLFLISLKLDTGLFLYNKAL